VAITNRKIINWRIAANVWVTVVNLVLASVFLLFLFDVWTHTPLIERAVFQATQAGLVAALAFGIVLHFRRSPKARRWNVSSQALAATFPCAVFLEVLHLANRNGERIDGIEAMLVWYGFWIFVACGVTWFLYSRLSLVQIRDS